MNATELALAQMDDDGWGCAITTDANTLREDDPDGTYTEATCFACGGPVSACDCGGEGSEPEDDPGGTYTEDDQGNWYPVPGLSADILAGVAAGFWLSQAAMPDTLRELREPS